MGFDFVNVSSSCNNLLVAMERDGLPNTPRIHLTPLPRTDREVFSRKYYKRTRLLTNAFLGFAVATCLIYDWDSHLGTNQHVFSGIRPAIRRTLDWAYGVEPKKSKDQTQERS